MPEQQLKPGWTQVKFGNVVRQVKDKVDPETAGLERYIAGEHMETDNLRIIKWGEIGSDYLGPAFHMRFKPGQVLYGSRRTYLRKVAVPDFEGICANTTFVLESKDPSVLLPDFLPFVMQTEQFHEHSVKQSKGSVNPYVNFSDLAWWEFALPPIEEQVKIVKLLASQNSLIDLQEKALSDAKVMKKASCKKFFARSPKTKKLKDSIFGKIPESWDVKSLGSIFNFLNNRRVPLKDSDRKERSGSYPYYGAAGPIDYIDGFIFDEHTLLLAEDGMNLVFRNSPIVYKATGKYWVSNHAHVLQPKENTDIDFYLEYLEHISYLPYITGTYQKKITRSDCEKIPVIYPPIDEQRETVTFFKSLTSQIESLENRILATRKLTKETLNRLLA